MHQQSKIPYTDHYTLDIFQHVWDSNYSSGGSRGFLGFRGTPLFVVLRACVAGLMRP